MDISVEDEFKEAVTSQLQMMKETRPDAPHANEVKLMSAQVHELSAPAAPTGLTIVEDNKADEVAPEVVNAMEFQVKPWGLVLVVREPAVKYLQGGGQITGSVLGGIGGAAGLTGLAAASSLLGPLGIIAGAVLAIVGAALGIYSAVISMMDQGKGVYLTWTWAQFVPFLVPPLIPNPMYGLPVVTPIT